MRGGRCLTPHLREAYWSLRRLAERRSLLFFEAPAAGGGPAAPPAGFTLGTAGPEPPGDVAAIRGATERLRAGHRLLYAEDGAGTILARGWLTLARGEVAAVPFECGLRLGVGPAQAYLWDFTTLPQARRRGLYAALLRHGRAVAAADGVVSVAIYCRRENAASATAILASGFGLRAELAVARAGPLRRLVTATDGRRRVLGSHTVPLDWVLGHSPPP